MPDVPAGIDDKQFDFLQETFTTSEEAYNRFAVFTMKITVQNMPTRNKKNNRNARKQSGLILPALK